MLSLRGIQTSHQICFICSRPTRSISTNLNEWHQNKTNLLTKYQNVSTRDAYSYEKLFPWRTLAQFSDYMISNIVYRKDNLVILNKPFGIRNYHERKKNTKSEISTSYLRIKDFPFSIEDVLPALKEHLNVSDLHIIKCAERYTSGIVIIGTDAKAAKDFSRSCDIAKQNCVPHLTHQFITAGNPIALHKKDRVGIKLSEVGKNEPEQPIIVSQVSKNACKKNIMMCVRLEYRVLTANQEAQSSLVEMATNSIKWHFLRIYASRKIASILGDFLFGSRTNYVLGMPVQLEPQSSHFFSPQPLPEALQEKLNLRKGTADAVGIPTMLHLKSVYLPSYHGKDITVVAEPPEHFKWTCAKLDLLS